MRDAAGHLREGPQAFLLDHLLLCFAQLRHGAAKFARAFAEGLLRLLAGGDIVHGEHQHGAFGTVDEVCAPFAEEFAAVQPTEENLAVGLVDGRGDDVRIHGRGRRLQTITEFQKRSPHQFVRLASTHVRGRLIGPQDPQRFGVE